MASASYHVTYHPDRRAGKQFWSFPWIACDNRWLGAAGGAIPMDWDVSKKRSRARTVSGKMHRCRL
jgi:hypothetical protein